MSNQDILHKYMGIIQQVEDGELSALNVAPEIKELADSFKELYDQLKDHIIEERGNYNDKEDVIRGGYEIRVQSRTYYKYGEDPSYDFLNEKLKARKKLIQKATDRKEPLTDPETGEMIEPVSTSTSVYPVLKFVGQQLKQE